MPVLPNGTGLMEFGEVRRLIRTAEVRRAVELTAKLAASAMCNNLPMYSDLIKRTPNERRLEYCAALRLSADRMRAYAAAMEEEAKRS
ncbi:hypothetical protein AYO40_01065 [Planctomycetaceae bacterium SCGC AG-212-D15]|nr:hypothetical protein AYO40_01065 [Planctomycetaceae bacterium SCGC AG-212-D15]